MQTLISRKQDWLYCYPIKVDVRDKNIAVDGERQFLMIKGSAQQESIAVLNIYAQKPELQDI